MTTLWQTGEDMTTEDIEKAKKWDDLMFRIEHNIYHLQDHLRNGLGEHWQIMLFPIVIWEKSEDKI